jgi:glycosyltransferase involved in cell wall biosynthesis
MDKIHVYSPCWNEEKILPYYLRHYEAVADKIFIFDNGSTDRSDEIIRAHPKAILKKLPYRKNQPLNRILDKVRNQKWQASKRLAQWIIVCDMDEFVHHPTLVHLLDDCRKRGVTVLRPYGYNMYSKKFPTTSRQIYAEVQEGVHSRWYDKMSVFSAEHIKNMKFTMGCHTAHPQGKVKIERFEKLNLLHFRFLGLDYITQRNKMGKSRRQADQKTGWSRHFTTDPQKNRRMAKPRQKTCCPPSLKNDSIKLF